MTSQIFRDKTRPKTGTHTSLDIRHSASLTHTTAQDAPPSRRSAAVPESRPPAAPIAAKARASAPGESTAKAKHPPDSGPSHPSQTHDVAQPQDEPTLPNGSSTPSPDSGPRAGRCPQGGHRWWRHQAAVISRRGQRRGTAGRQTTATSSSRGDTGLCLSTSQWRRGACGGGSPRWNSRRQRGVITPCPPPCPAKRWLASHAPSRPTPSVTARTPAARRQALHLRTHHGDGGLRGTRVRRW